MFSGNMLAKISAHQPTCRVTCCCYCTHPHLQINKWHYMLLAVCKLHTKFSSVCATNYQQDSTPIRIHDNGEGRPAAVATAQQAFACCCGCHNTITEHRVEVFCLDCHNTCTAAAGWRHAFPPAASLIVKLQITCVPQHAACWANHPACCELWHLPCCCCCCWSITTAALLKLRALRKR